MFSSITSESWEVNATDPTALTRLLDLPGMVVTGVKYDAELGYLTVVCEHVEQVAICPTCGTLSQHIHLYHPRRVRDLPLSDHPCVIAFQARRFKCHHCARPFTEVLSWLEPNVRLTQRYATKLFARCRGTTIQQLSSSSGRSVTVATSSDRRRSLSCDEKSERTGHLCSARNTGQPAEIREKALEGCRLLLVKNATDLNEAEQAKLTAMGQAVPILRELHWLKEDFRTIFEIAISRESAAQQLQSWMAKAEQSGLEQLTKFVGTCFTYTTCRI